jgi:hypothetical protein
VRAYYAIFINNKIGYICIKLSSIQITELFEYIGQLITINSIEADLQKDCKEKHFSNGQACPICGSLHVNSLHSNLKEWIR